MADRREMEIVRRVIKGDTDAFETLVTENQKKIYNLAYRMVRNEQDALDLTQEAFLKAYRSLSQYRGESGFSVWLYRLASNICIDFLRKKKKQNIVSLVYDGEDGETAEMDIADESQSPERVLEKSEARRAVAAGLEKLSEEHRKIILLRDVDGYSYEEIAAVLSIEMGTVKSRLARARSALRSELEKTGNFSAKTSSVKEKGV